MTALFADTFYWIALADFNDSAHQQVLALTTERTAWSIVTTDEVLAEYLTFSAVAPAPLRHQVAASVQAILTNLVIRVIPQSRSSFLAGLDLYIQRPDKGYSLTDCISMQTMWREGLTEALTRDRHFEQEGFRVLFR
jgi:predicted nucleic acid-binding protein